MVRNMKNLFHFANNIDHKEYWSKFCDDSTIHGIRYIFGSSRRSIFYRVMWTLMFSSMVFICIWLCTVSIQRYLEYDVKTTTTFELQTQIDFPAITFCNINMFRKSIVGPSTVFLKYLAFATMNLDETFDERLKDIQSTCAHTKRNEYTDFLENETFYETFGTAESMKIMAMDSFQNVVSCWWDVKPISCGKIFLNHFLDYGWCFTFNPSTSTLNSFRLDKPDKSDSNAYGINESTHRQKQVSNAGSMTGLRVLLNVRQLEYCDVMTWMGAGFDVFVHDPNSQPYYGMDSPVRLSPGFDTYIALRPTIFKRNAEKEGHCIKKIYLYVYPKAEVYTRSLCYLQCLAEKVYQACNCTPPFCAGADKTVAEQFNVEEVRVCFNEDSFCMNNVSLEMNDNNIQTVCSYCMQPCDETVYNIEVSSVVFPPENTIEVYERKLKMKIDDIRNNYLLVKFYLESMSVQIITETQDFSFLDLVSYIGGLLGLFLGMSFLSVGEVLDVIWFYCKNVTIDASVNPTKVSRIPLKKGSNGKFKTLF